MNKKKITLLIALSITILACIVLVCIGKNKKVETKEIIIKEQEVIEEKEEEIVELLPANEIAKEILQGKWGNGEERKANLISAGYNYEEVQAEVDKLIPKAAIKTTTTTYTFSLPAGDYPEARLIWDRMRSWGWSQETCAGIIGNIMAEIGGGTLNLKNWKSNDGCGYGLIQWTGGRAALIKNRYGAFPNIEQQLLFIKDELFGANDTKQQVSSNILNIILNTDGSQTPESVALTFATYYERCGASHRAKRQGYARTAYQYFME